MVPVPAYDKYAPFYDLLMHDLQRTQGEDVNRFADRARDRIRRYAPGASTVLELGCGTGTVLAAIGSPPSLTGLDLSPEMLAAARSKVPAATFIEGDMAAFDLGRQFDVVICVFDSLNHLTVFDQWISMFSCVHAHLADGGIFIFDVVTTATFRRLSNHSPYVHNLGRSTMIATGQFADDMWVLDMRIFEHVEEDRFTVHHVQIPELAVPADRITGALAPRFKILELTDYSGKPPRDDTGRLHFVAARR